VVKEHGRLATLSAHSSPTKLQQPAVTTTTVVVVSCSSEL